MIAAGKMRLRVTVQERSDVRGTRGQPTEDWETLESRWASKQDVSGSEQQWVRQIAPMATTAFTMRRPRTYSLTSQHRLVYGGANYHVISIVGDDQTDDTITVLCGSKGP